MMSVLSLPLSDSDYKRLYEEQTEKVSLLEDVLKISTAEQIKRSLEEIEVLKSERDRYKGLSESADKRVSDITEEANKRVSEIERAYKIQQENIESSIRAEKEQQLKDFKKNTKSKTVKPLENKIKALESENTFLKSENKQLKDKNELLTKTHIEDETLLKSRDEEILRLNSIDTKIDNLGELISSKFEIVLDAITGGCTKEELVRTIENVSASLGGKATTQQIENECRQIHGLLASGKSQKEVAALLYPKLARKEQKVAERLKSKTYIRLFGGH